MRHLATAFLAALPLAAPAPAAPAQHATSCDISAYAIDRDPKGLNVRAAPSVTARIVRVVDNAASGVARIKGQNRAWFRISAIVDAETNEPLFRGNGWMHASLLGLDVANGDPKLYAEPRARSRVLARLMADQSQVTLIGCEGRWAKVRAAAHTGWLSPGGQCSSPLTTCS